MAAKFPTAPFNLPRLLAVAVLLLHFGLALGAAVYNAPTMDEQGFIVRGLAYLRAEHRQIRVGHPLGLNAVNAALLAEDGSVALPTEDPSWQGTSFHRPAELFLWEIGNDVGRIMFLARLPSIWLGMLLAAVVGRWAWEMSRSRWAGWLALTLVALDPNVLAHAGLATTDLGLAAAAALAGFTLWRFLRRPTWPGAIIAGAAFGLLQNTKFTALLFVPLFGLVILVWLVRWRRAHRDTPLFGRDSPLVQLAVAYPLAGLLTLWAAYGFDVGPLPDNLPVFGQLGGRPVPLAHHLEQLLDIGGRLQVSTPSFLRGRYSDHGWWTYFPVAFLLKTPLPTLILLVWAAIRSRLRSVPATPDLAALLIPALGYFAIAMTSDINLGYRHLLPVLPFLAVFVATTLAPHTSRAGSPAARALFFLLPAWLAAAALFIFPHFLSFFNVLAGGPENGWRSLVDSNLDWGQDLAGLKAWMAENGVDHVWLSYFGEARPAYYGISYTGLDSFPPRLMNPQARPLYPHDPAPGYYAISATNLQGVHFEDHDVFGWFRERPPLAKIGYSIFIYRVPAYGEPVTLALSGLQLDELAPADYALLGTNQVAPVWFDAGQSLPAAPEWLALADGVAFDPLLEALFEAAAPAVAARGAGYTLYRLHWSDAFATALDASYRLDPMGVPFEQQAGQIVLAESAIQTPRPGPAGEVVLLTAWEQRARPQPVKIFVHLVDDGDAVPAQWDGLGLAWEGWREGITLYQLHRLVLPADAPAGTYRLWAGLYHPDTGQRWTTPAGPDGRVLLGELTVTGRE